MPFSKKLLMVRRELTLFLIVGSVSILLDFLIYSSIAHSTAIHVGVAKGTSFLVGTVFTYFANRFLTFGHTKHQEGSTWRYGILYLLTLNVNVTVNAVALRLFSDPQLSTPLAFLSATGISSALNFLGMKWFVFRASAFQEIQ